MSEAYRSTASTDPEAQESLFFKFGLVQCAQSKFSRSLENIRRIRRKVAGRPDHTTASLGFLP